MKKLVLAAAVSAAMFAGQTYAVPASVKVVPLISGAVDFSTATGIYASGNTVNEVWISGSSAATPFLEKAVINDAIGTVYKYQDSGKKAFTYVSESSLVPGTFNVVHKRDSGGSITAIKSAQGILTQYNDTSAIAGGLAAISATCGPVAASGVATCITVSTITLTDHAANANFSDVDATQFQSALNGGVANASTVSNTAVAAQTFGFAVNLKLRNAMQVAMIASGTLPGCAAGSETEACMPNLTSEQLSSIFASGRVTDWGNIRFGGATGQNLFTAQATLDRPANRDIHICSRTAGSGTLATTNIKFENAPCFAGNEAIQAATTQTITSETGTTNGALKAYHSMSGSGDLENCLVGLNSGAATSTFNTYPGTVGTGSPVNFRWAIGILGTERNAANTLDYRFIKIDGASPSAKNVAQGKYKFWAELVLVGTTATDTLTTDLIANVKNANQISTVNVNNANFGVTGYLGVANNAAFLPTFNADASATGGTVGLISAAFDTNRPVMPFTHEAAAGGSLNHCRVPTVGTGSRALPALN